MRPREKFDVSLDWLFFGFFLPIFLETSESLVNCPLPKFDGVGDGKLDIGRESSIEHGANDGASTCPVPVDWEISKRIPNRDDAERCPIKVGIGQQDNDTRIQELTDEDGDHDLPIQLALLVEPNGLNKHNHDSPDNYILDRHQNRSELLNRFDLLTFKVVVVAERIPVEHTLIHIWHFHAVALVDSMAIPNERGWLVHLGQFQKMVVWVIDFSARLTVLVLRIPGLMRNNALLHVSL
jgi:hypothetical protein